MKSLAQMIIVAFIKIIFTLRLHDIYRFMVQRGKVSIILFHDCDKEVFRRSILYFKKHYNIISLNQYINGTFKEPNNKPYLIITFDDGSRKNHDLLDIIIDSEIPVTIFLIYDLIINNEQFWWNIDGLTDKVLKEMKTFTNDKREKLTSKLMSKSIKHRDALNLDQINKMKKFIDFQSHTLSHPILNKCNDETSWKEINASKKKLETLLNKKIEYFAYPNGDYGDREIKFLEKARYKAALTVKHGFNNIKVENKFELKRILVGDGKDYLVTVTCATGIYSTLKNFFGLSRTFGDKKNARF